MKITNLANVEGCPLQNFFDLVWAASKACLEIYNSPDFDVKLKADQSPVTAADLAVHHIILEGIKKLTPLIPLVSEEAKTSYETRKAYKKYWLLDPIDGTKEFIKKSGEFTINLGLISDGKPIFGIVHVPVQDKLYFGGSAIGDSFCCTRDSGVLEVLSLKFLQAARIVENTNNLIVACSKDHSSQPDNEFILKLAEDFFVKRVRLGSTLKQLRLAEGEVHFCPRAYAPYDWDLAAVHAIVQGAGGDVITFEGGPLTYNTESQRLKSFIAVCDLSFNWRKYIPEVR